MDAKKLLEKISNKSDDDLKEIDKKIHIKVFKDGNRLKTEITGLEDFMKVDDIKPFTKKMKEQHGCSGTISVSGNEADGKKKITFSGNQTDNNKTYIIKAGITTLEFIK